MAAVLTLSSLVRRPADFPKTVALCQSYVTAVYLAIGIVVYCESGPSEHRHCLLALLRRGLSR